MVVTVQIGVFTAAREREITMLTQILHTRVVFPPTNSRAINLSETSSDAPAVLSMSTELMQTSLARGIVPVVKVSPSGQAAVSQMSSHGLEPNANARTTA